MTEEATKEMAITIPMEKFPRLQAINKEIDALKELVECLNKRKTLINSSTEDVTPYQKNENKITLIKTDRELAKVHTLIIHKQRDVKDYLDKVVYPFIGEIESGFDTLMIKAKEKAKKDGVLAKVLNDVDQEVFKDNWEHKFNHYIAIKNYLDPKKVQKTMRKV